jgi:hypothetical protein
MLEVMPLLLGCTMLAIGAVLFSSDVQAPTAAVPVVTTAETLVAVGFPVTLPSGSGKAVVRGWMLLTVGAATTAVTIAIYRGSAIGGPLVGSKIAQAGNFVAGEAAAFEANFIDMLSGVSGAQYCMSVTQTGATGNGNVSNAIIDTRVFSG